MCQWIGYLNGMSLGIVSQSFGTITDTQSLNIGFGSSAGEYFTGELDELTIFDRPLLPSEVNALAQSQGGINSMTLTFEPGDILSATNSIVVPANSVVYLPFEEDSEDAPTQFVDRSGSNNDATCSGTACPTASVTGQGGSALRFDGTDDMLAIANTDDINLGIHTEHTVAAWFWVDESM